MNEFLLTFSNLKSKYCSKKIERFACFALAIAMIVSYYTVSIFGCDIIAVCKITSSEVVMLAGVLLTYGGYNTKQIFNDKTASES